MSGSGPADLSTALALASILAFWRHPTLSVALFAAAMLTKLSAPFALPVVLLWSFTRRSDPDRAVPSPLWLAAFTLVLVAVAVPELAAFQRTGEYIPTLGDSPIELFRSIVAIAGRYFWMAATSLGVSAYQSVGASPSSLDPWFLAGAVGLIALGGRSVYVLLRGEEEVGYWALAFASFLPICQIFPFVYPMADRYLYAVLPGLLGGSALAARSIYRRFASAGETSKPRTSQRWIAVGLGATCSWASAFRFAAWTGRRSSNPKRDCSSKQRAATPTASLRGCGGPRKPDASAMPAALPPPCKKLRTRGFLSPAPLLATPAIGRHAGHPKVRAVIRAMAGDQVKRLSALERPHQIELYLLGQAHLQRDETAAAIRALERALEVGGPEDAAIREALRSLERR